MPRFSEHSKTELITCHPDLRLVANIAIRYIDFRVLEGRRDEERQNQLQVEGKSQLRYPESKHNAFPSLAFDFCPWPCNWHNTEEFVLVAGHILAIGAMLGIELRWGGDWDSDHDTDDERFRDYGHIELVWADRA